ncbi:hypothetical protein SPONN_2336 [uncultured Candidatus Thioglobus sp.]|nr:hypothetical protein SPONN_2336 [uncultured Candidatus Thioglobus sp.]
MKKLTILALSTIIAVSSLSLSVQAEGDNSTYFGIGINQSKWNDSDTVSGVTVDVEYKKINWKVLIGQQIDDNFAVELQYANFGKKDLVANGTTVPIELSGKSIGIAGLYHFNADAAISPFVKLGYHSWDLKATAANASGKDDGNDVFYGVGVDGKINETIKYRVEFERMKVKSDNGNTNMDNIGVGLLFDF